VEHLAFSETRDQKLSGLMVEAEEEERAKEQALGMTGAKLFFIGKATRLHCRLDVNDT
jgi:hypothetical protein